MINIKVQLKRQYATQSFVHFGILHKMTAIPNRLGHRTLADSSGIDPAVARQKRLGNLQRCSR